MFRPSPHHLASLLVLAACASTDSPMTTPTDAALDLHSFARPQQVAVTHLELDIDLDFAARTVSGAATLTVVRRDPTAPLWLDTQDLDIESVTAVPAGTALQWQLGDADPQLGRSLRIDLQKGVEQVAIRYSTTPGANGAMQWLEPEQTSGDQPFLFTQGQAILTRTWIPLQDSPGVRLTWNARVRAPKGLRPLMSAMQSGGDAESVYTFAMTRPVPSYLIALACGRLERREISGRCAVWAEPAVIERAAKELEDMERMVSACEQLFGPYRWGRYDVLVLPPSFPFGGMENPCLTFATPTILAGDKSLVGLIAHELAHSWSGNLVTNATWRDFWLNEGFTVFLEQRIMEHVYGKERSDMEIELAVGDLRREMADMPPVDQVLHIDLTGRNPDDGMTSVPYEKGAGLLRRLEQIVGRPRFDAFLRSWFDAHAFQSVTTATLEDYLARHLLISAEERAAVDLQTWIHGPGLPADLPVPTAKAFAAVDAAARDLLRTKSAERLPPMADWSTQQWMRLLRAVPAYATLLAELDRARSFTNSGNSEILCRWLELAIEADYQPAMPRLREFLLGVGRRKFLKPLYEALLRSTAGTERAKGIYQDARKRYHPVAVRTLDELMHWQGQ